MIVFVPHHISVKKIAAPASKSHAQRVLLAAALSHQTIELINAGYADDTLNMMDSCIQLGAKISGNEHRLMIRGHQNPVKRHINVGESGLGVRLLTPVAATFGGEFHINGKGSLLKRPLGQFNDFLPQMGVDVNLKNNVLPITLKGKLKGGNYKIDGSLSSQYISGLLMALPLCEENSVLTIHCPTSKPYIDLTIDVLKHFDIEIIQKDNDVYLIKGRQVYKPVDKQFKIEGDWSGAAFWVVFGLIKGTITIDNLQQNSIQADKTILEVVKLVGGSFYWNGNRLVINSDTLKPFQFNAENCPDLFPPLVVLAAAIKGKSVITGVKRLIYKESNRAEVLQKEFLKLGLNIQINNNDMIIEGKGHLHSGTILATNDHRIAMAGAMASQLTINGVTINNAECVNKSYPNFWQFVKKNVI